MDNSIKTPVPILCGDQVSMRSQDLKRRLHRRAQKSTVTPRKHTHGTLHRDALRRRILAERLFSELIGELRFRLSYSFQVEPPSQEHSQLLANSRTLKSLMLVPKAAMWAARWIDSRMTITSRSTSAMDCFT